MQPDQNPTKEEQDAQWEQRTLCSDGNCIGVIGPDGRCKECAKPFEGELPDIDETSDAAVPPPGPDIEQAPEMPDHTSTEDAASGESDDWENRRLCPDGNCIGVIGPDRRCKECGKPG